MEQAKRHYFDSLDKKIFSSKYKTGNMRFFITWMIIIYQILLK